MMITEDKYSELKDHIRVLENRLKRYTQLVDESELLEQCEQYEKLLEDMGNYPSDSIMDVKDWARARMKLAKVLGKHRFLKDHPLKDKRF